MITALIVDDEKHAREKLRMFIARQTDFTLAGEAANGDDALRLINKLRPDVVFLDIRMPFPDGIEVVLQLTHFRPRIVFTTAYDEYAIKAFELAALDYILKPFDSQRFELTLQRIRTAVSEKDNAANQNTLTEAAESISAYRMAETRSITVKIGDKYVIQPLNDIIAFEADGNYIKVHCNTGSHLIRQTLSVLQASLNPAEFIRTHRSFIVNTSAIKELHPLFNSEFVILMKNGAKFPCSRTYSSELRKFFSF